MINFFISVCFSVVTIVIYAEACYEDSRVCPDGFHGPDGTANVKRDPLKNCHWEACISDNTTLPKCPLQIKSCQEGLHGPDGSIYIHRNPTTNCTWEQCVSDDAPVTVEPPAECNDDFQFCPDGITIISRNPYDHCNFFPCDTITVAPTTTTTTALPTTTAASIPLAKDEIKLKCLRDQKLCTDKKTKVRRDPNILCDFPPC